MKQTKALDLMRAGSILIREHSHDENAGEYYLLPGGKIDARLAAFLQSHPQVYPNEDGLRLNFDQTWKIR